MKVLAILIGNLQFFTELEQDDGKYRRGHVLQRLHRGSRQNPGRELIILESSPSVSVTSGPTRSEGAPANMTLRNLRGQKEVPVNSQPIVSATGAGIYGTRSWRKPGLWHMLTRLLKPFITFHLGGLAGLCGKCSSTPIVQLVSTSAVLQADREPEQQGLATPMRRSLLACISLPSRAPMSHGLLQDFVGLEASPMSAAP